MLASPHKKQKGQSNPYNCAKYYMLHISILRPRSNWPKSGPVLVKIYTPSLPPSPPARSDGTTTPAGAQPLAWCTSLHMIVMVFSGSGWPPGVAGVVTVTRSQSLLSRTRRRGPGLPVSESRSRSLSRTVSVCESLRLSARAAAGLSAAMMSSCQLEVEQLELDSEPLVRRRVPGRPRRTA